MNNEKQILMIGPDKKAQGGIASVIALYEKFNLCDGNIIYLKTYTNGSIFIKFFIYFLFIVQYLYILLVNKNVKLVHIHTSSRGSFLRKSIIFFIAKMFRKKTILHIHGSEFMDFYNESSLYVTNIIRNVLENVDLVIALSSQWKDKLLSISKKANIRVLYNATTQKNIKHISSDSVNVLFMGRLGHRKGVYDILEAAKYIENPKVVINLYGDGEIEQVNKLIIDNNLEKKVKIGGWISGEKKEEVYNSSDIFILPSYNEGLPMSILEAMSYGLPIIATNIDGIPETIDKEMNGFMIQPGDYKTLAEKIDLLANNKELRLNMGHKSCEIALEKFDINNINQQLCAIYEELINENLDINKKIYILFEDDWELKGNGIGNVQELQYKPANFLMDLCEKLNIKMTFMIDVAQQLTFLDYVSYPEIKEQAELWDNTVCLMKQRGFDAQLHLHPQWLNAKYKKGFFYVNKNWNIGTYDNSERRDLVKKSIKYLEELIKPIDNHYKVNSFKPGSWAIQPSEGILNDLADNGIKLVVGLKKGLYIPKQKIDLRKLEEDTYPYYPDFKDITKISTKQERLIAFPLACYTPSVFDLSKLVFYFIKKQFINKFNKNEFKQKPPIKIKKLNPFLRSKLNYLFRPYVTHLKINNQSFEYLKKSFDTVIDRFRSSNETNPVLILESHTKDYIYNYKNIEKFLTYVSKEYSKQVEFITLTEFLKGVEDNQFSVKCKE